MSIKNQKCLSISKETSMVNQATNANYLVIFLNIIIPPLYTTFKRIVFMANKTNF